MTHRRRAGAGSAGILPATAQSVADRGRTLPPGGQARRPRSQLASVVGGPWSVVFCASVLPCGTLGVLEGAA
jgi:hypothetical protein